MSHSPPNPRPPPDPHGSKISRKDEQEESDANPRPRKTPRIQGPVALPPETDETAILEPEQEQPRRALAKERQKIHWLPEGGEDAKLQSTFVNRAQEDLARATAEKDRLSQALQQAQQRIQSAKKAHEHTLFMIEKQAHSYKQKNMFKEASELYADCLEGRKQASGANHCRTLQVMSRLAFSYLRLNKYKKAEKLYLECLGRRKKTFGCQDQKMLKKMFINMHHLAFCYIEQQKFYEAKKVCKKCLQRYKRTPGAYDDRRSKIIMDSFARQLSEL